MPFLSITNCGINYLTSVFRYYVYLYVYFLHYSSFCNVTSFVKNKKAVKSISLSSHGQKRKCFHSFLTYLPIILLQDTPQIGNGTAGAFYRAHTAGKTKLIPDTGKIIFDPDGTGRAGLLAKTTAHAGR